MKEDLLKLKKQNRAKGWLLKDMWKALGVSSETYYRIIRRRGYAKNSLNPRKKIKLEQRIDELLNNEVTI